MSVIIEGINKREFCELLLCVGFMDVANINYFFDHEIKEMPDPKVIAARMKVLDEKYKGDEEVLHVMADGELCDLLRELGYGEAIDIFDEMHKWYA